MLFIDIKAGKEYNYTYEGGRLVRSAEHNVTFDAQYNIILRDYVGTIDYTYGKDGRLVKKNVYVYGASVQYFTEYPENANPVVKVKYNNQSIESHSKTDSFGRKEFEELQAGTGFISRQFMYERGKATEEHKQNGKLKSSPTTNLVKQIIFHDDRTLSYEYDKEERITKVTDSLEGVTEYTYDAQGQLLTEVKDSVTVNTMTYDNYGNILSKNGVIYEYNSVWKDKLIKVGTGENSTITYDAQGNPTNYLGHTLTWEKGRQLKSFGNNTYTYNANGIRTSKTVNGVKHTFMLEGGKITKEAWGENTLLPLYNNENSICGIIYNRVMYLFLKNLQGDIIAITNQNGETIARYAYDAWGKCTVIQDSSNCLIATINPFRYRGYYYDQEIGMYYLQSRYYDPNVGRFINADAPNFVAISGENLFSYCGNCPTKNADYAGYCFTPTYWEEDSIGTYRVFLVVQVPNKNDRYSRVAWHYTPPKDFSAGHVFLRLEYSNISLARGFRPKSDETLKITLMRNTVEGKVIEEKSKSGDVEKCYLITKSQYEKIHSFLYKKDIPQYNIVTYNCANFALDALESANIKHNFKKHYWDIGSIETLLKLYLIMPNIFSPIFPGLTFLVSGFSKDLADYALSFSKCYGYYPAALACDIGPFPNDIRRM